MTVRSAITLADGRELLYFDADDLADRTTPDLRTDLKSNGTASEVRWDPLFRDYSVVAGHRQSRTYKPSAAHCPLCPSTPQWQTEIPAAGYEVVVFENRFPSFRRQAQETHEPAHAPLFPSGPGTGRCEVVCFSSDHDSSFAQLGPDRVETVIDAWIDRTRALSDDSTIEYVLCFENRGEDIGVTLSHPHGQIYGYPFIPPRFFRAAESARRYQDKHGRCLQCALLEAELADGHRIVTESEHWVGYVPFAARWPYEVRLVPRAHYPDLVALDDQVKHDLAHAYLDILRRFDGLFDAPAPYIASWQQAPVRQSRELWHVAAEVFTIQRAPGKLKYLAGSESAAAVWINDVTPEQAAARLRKVHRRAAERGLAS